MKNEICPISGQPCRPDCTEEQWLGSKFLAEAFGIGASQPRKSAVTIIHYMVVPVAQPADVDEDCDNCDNFDSDSSSN